MRLKILGAAQEVTGSMYLIEVGGHRVLVDCGMHQGRNEEANYEAFNFDATSIDALLLTHAHIDHSGRIPLLVRQGFSGKIYATLPTTEVVEILWFDAAHIMQEDAQWLSRKNERKGLPPVEPLFGDDDVEAALKRLVPVSYDDRIPVVPGLDVRFRDAGHIVGSSILEVFLSEGDQSVKVVFSGDLGPANPVLDRQPAEISEADYVLIESTYGDRDHRSNEETRKEFQELMARITSKKSKVFIPTFVVDRAQRIMYELSLLRDRGVIEADLPIYFDSPMGARTTKVYEEHMDLMSQEVQAYRREGGSPFSKEQITFVSTVEESQAINRQKYGVVMAGSGMITGGRMVHHLKNGLWNADNHLVFVGYQAVGTLGRRIVDGAKSVRIGGEEVAVKATVHTINGFSAHADRTDLLGWAEFFRPSMPQFIVTHGEPHASDALASGLQERGFEALVPAMEQEFNLVPRTAGAALSKARADREAVGPLERKTAPVDDVSDRLEKEASLSKGKAAQKSATRGTTKQKWQDLKTLHDLDEQLQVLHSHILDSGTISAEERRLIEAATLLLQTAERQIEERQK